MSEELAPLAASIVDVVSGTGTEEQREWVEQWSRERPEHRLMLEQVRRALQPRRPDRAPVDVEAIVQAVRQRIDRAVSGEYSGASGQEVQDGESRVGLKVHSSPDRDLIWRKRDWRRFLRRGSLGMQPLRGGGIWYPVAGLVLGAVFVIAGWTLGTTSIRRWFAGADARYTTYATAPGQRATITLPDGNTVVLNVASRLEVPVDYGTGDHVVRLPVGEALFTVSHHAGTSFTVVSGTITTRVLGTRFMVRHYLTDTIVTVAVQDGKVAVGNAVVTALRLIEVGRTERLRERSADQGAFAFATGILALPQMRLSEAIPDLDRWYNGEIRLADPALGDQELTGKFTPGSLADLAEFLTVATGGRVVRNGRVLTLYARAGR